MPDYSVDQLFGKLERADAAGDTEAAKVIAAEIRRVQAAPQQKPDFSGTRGGSQSTESAQPTGERRGVMLSARSALEGVGGVADFVSSPLRAGIQMATGKPQATYTDLAGGLSDRLGLPRPANSRERVLGDVGRSLSGAAVTMGAGAALPVANRARAFLTAQPVAQIAGSAGGAAASGMTRENGGGTGAQLLAGLVGSVAPGGLAATGGGLTRLLARGGENGQKAMQRTISDFASVGATPSVGQATGGRFAQGAESLLAGGPTSGGVMSKFAESQAEKIGGGLQSRANAISPNASAERAGRAVEKGAELFKGNVGATKKALYWEADRYIPATTQVPLQNTWQEVVRLTTPNAGASATTGAMVNPKITAMRKTLQQDLAAGGGNITYDAMKRIRSEIGEALGDYSLVSDTPTREYKALYAALSRDMEGAAALQGPAATLAAKRANNFTRAAADRMETLSRVVDRNGGPERIYSAVMSGTKDGGTTLRSVLQSLPQDGQKAITAAVIKRMGLANPGAQDATGEVFSSATFLRKWNDVSPEARRALFDRYGPAFSESMDKIARVASNIKDGSKVYANPSGTANRAAAISYFTSLPAAGAVGAMGAGPMPLVGLVLSGLAANGGARLMTNPKFVRWLANSTSAPRGAAMASLQVMAQSDPDVADLYRSLSEQAYNRQDQTGRDRQ